MILNQYPLFKKKSGFEQTVNIQLGFGVSWTVRHVRKDERKYYEELLKYSRDHLMLYPYHLSDIMVKGLRVTPFSYYVGIMEVSATAIRVDVFY